MERLTNRFDYCEFIECKWRDSELAKVDKCKFFDATSRDKCHEKAVYEKLREYEDAEEQGLLLRLPCKVGDTVWCLEENECVGYVFIAISGEHYIVSADYVHCDDIYEQLEEMEDDTENGFEPSVSVFHKVVADDLNEDCCNPKGQCNPNCIHCGGREQTLDCNILT